MSESNKDWKTRMKPRIIYFEKLTVKLIWHQARLNHIPEVKDGGGGDEDDASVS